MGICGGGGLCGFSDFNEVFILLYILRFENEFFFFIVSYNYFVILI